MNQSAINAVDEDIASATLDADVLNYREPAQKASKIDRQKAFATWKFELFDTVDADPRLVKAPGLSVMRVYAKYGKRVGRHVTAYASTPTLMAETGKSRSTVRRTRDLLVKLRYLVEVGTTESGSVIYRIENPHRDFVRMQMLERKWKIDQGEIERKENERRRKRAIKPDGGLDMTPPEFDEGVHIRPDRGLNMNPNSLEESLLAWAHEEEGSSTGFPCGTVGEQVNSYASAKDGGEDTPFPIPANEAEAELTMFGLCESRVVPVVLRSRLKSMLMSGVLTPRMAEGILGPRKEKAA